MWTAQDIRQLRQRLRMDVPHFASNLGVAEWVVSRWELGLSEPSAWEETKLADLEPSILRDKARLAEVTLEYMKARQNSPVKTFLVQGGGSVSSDGHSVYISEPNK